MKTVCSLLLAAAATTLAGCASSNPNDVSYSAITSDLSPSMRSLTERPVDIHSHAAYRKDVNSRLLIDDLQRFFYLDHPSRLSPYDIPYRSGQPR